MRLLQTIVTSMVLLVICNHAVAQTPAEREAQKLVPRTPGSWPAEYTVAERPEQMRKPGTSIGAPFSNNLASAYCKGSQIYAKPADGYINYLSDYETCIEPSIHDSQPLGLSALAFEELCHSAAFVHTPKPDPGMVQARWVFACTLEKFTDTTVQINTKLHYIYNNPNGACYNDPSAICGNTVRLSMRTTCALVANEPSPQWDCFFDGVKTLATKDRRTESLPDFSNPVPTDVASQQALLKLIEDHVKSHI